MRLIHHLPFTAQELESYRQLVFNNLTHGMKYILDAMDDMELKVAEDNFPHIAMIEEARDLRDGEAFPIEFYQPLVSLWTDPNVQRAWERGNEAALPEKYASSRSSQNLVSDMGPSLLYFFSHLERLFEPSYHPSEQDIVHARARTIGITETRFALKEHEMQMVDVGGQKSERRKWIHCFQDVTSILFLASLSGYDQCLVEDKDAVSVSFQASLGECILSVRIKNQMQDAMTIWDSICHSQWFKQTSIVRPNLSTWLFRVVA